MAHFLPPQFSDREPTCFDEDEAYAPWLVEEAGSTLKTCGQSSEPDGLRACGAGTWRPPARADSSFICWAMARSAGCGERGEAAGDTETLGLAPAAVRSGGSFCVRTHVQTRLPKSGSS